MNADTEMQQQAIRTVSSSVGDSLMAPKQPSDAMRNMISPVTISTMGGASTRPSTK